MEKKEARKHLVQCDECGAVQTITAAQYRDYGTPCRECGANELIDYEETIAMHYEETIAMHYDQPYYGGAFDGFTVSSDALPGF